MDWTSIIVAVITGGLSLLGVYVANRKSAALIAYRLQKLEEKQDKHNAVIERTYKAEEDIVRLQDEEKRQNERIKNLEQKVG